MKRFMIGWLATALTASWVESASAELLPSEIAIIDVRDSRESRAVAAYYAKVRSIPTDHLIHLQVPAGEDLSRENWTKTVRPQIRRWLSQNGRLSKIRCFVTVWDVPLRITAETKTSSTDRMVAYLREERQLRIDRINGFTTTLLGESESNPELTNPLAQDAGLDEIKQRFDAMFAAANAAANALSDEGQRQAALQELQSIYFQSVGLNMMVQSLARQIQGGAAGTTPRVRSEYDLARGRTLGLREGRAAMEVIPFSLEREPQLLALIQLSDGIYGTLAWIDEQIKALTKNESYASFDSELSLVAWPTYNAVRWMPNYLHYRYDGTAIRNHKKTFMVSRIEAPTLKRTRAIIDEAIEVEKSGLQGKVYLDARGLAKLEDTPQPGSYPDYDQAILKAHDLITKHTDLEVVLNSSQELFQAGEAPDAALYCGWYSLAEYVDAFDWKPGSLGYHMASAEATTLRDANSQVWCKRMLEDGVAATMGPVNEPYITAFPRPNEFFALLLSGKHSLVECFFRTKPFNSWTMTLVGDPLYTPYRATAPLRIDELDPLTRRIINAGADGG